MSSFNMGVIYKLKKEVVDFIVSEKQANPDISCRKLSDIIKEKFQTEVSKSSVNAVIKEAHLSSPVGRRTKSPGQPQGFKIPKEKKIELKESFVGEILPLLEDKTTEPVTEDPVVSPDVLPVHTKIQEIQEVIDPLTTKQKEKFNKEDVVAEEPVLDVSAPPPEEGKTSSVDEIIEQIKKSTDEPKDKILPEITPELPQPIIKKEEAIETPLFLPSLNTDEKKGGEEPKTEAPVEDEDRPHLIPDPIVPISEPVAKEEIVKTPEPPLSQETVAQDSSVPETHLEEKPILKEESTEPQAPPSGKKYVDDKIWTPGSEMFTPLEKAAREQSSLTGFTPEEKSKTSVEKAQLYDGLGCFFLKAAEWELSSSSVLGGLLNRYVKGYIATDINLASEVLLYLLAFDINDLKNFDSYQKEGLWKIHEAAQKLSPEVLSKIIEGVHDVKSFSMAVANEYSQLFSETSYIKLSLKDNTDICFDAQQKSIWQENNVQPIFPIPLNKSLGYLSTNFISNVQPIIICGVPGYKNFAKQFYDMTLVFDGNFPDKNIVKIGIFDADKTEIAKFSSVPAKKRFFIAGVWPWQEECKRFMEEDLRIIKQFYSEILGKEIYYSELKTRLDQQIIGTSLEVRVALIRETGLAWPVMGILTNMDEKTSMEDIIATYLLRWPNGQEGHDDFVAKTEKASYGAMSIAPSHDRVGLLEGGGQYDLLTGKPDFWINIQFFLSALNNYCQRHFFPPHYEKLDFPSIKERFYGLSGFIQKDAQSLIVTLVVPAGYGYLKDLEYSIRRFNESDIRDPKETKLVIKITEQAF